MSTYFTLMSGIKASLDGLGLDVPTSIRSNVFLLDGEQPPLIIISAGAENEFIKFNTFAKLTAWNYPVNVVIVWPNNRSINQGYAQYLDLRQAVRDELYQIEAPGFEITFDTEIDAEPVSQFAALARSNWQITGWKLTYSSTSVRRGN